MILFILGLISGGTIGVFILALCIAAKNSNEKTKK
ncbi:MAG: DUF3789 domain-containing protein [Clostridium sp.]|nr:DUF3789 domain-containing protein [Clostridium sp.]MCM1547865.1 DUF3789 domain-containing protein [Ruminococcus sp.]